MGQQTAAHLPYHFLFFFLSGDVPFLCKLGTHTRAHTQSVSLTLPMWIPVSQVTLWTFCWFSTRLGQCNSHVKSQCQSLYSCKNLGLVVNTESTGILSHCTHFPAHFCSKVIIDKIMGIFRYQYIKSSDLCNSEVVWKIYICPFHLSIHPPLHHKF